MGEYPPYKLVYSATLSAHLPDSVWYVAVRCDCAAWLGYYHCPRAPAISESVDEVYEQADDRPVLRVFAASFPYT